MASDRSPEDIAVWIANILPVQRRADNRPSGPRDEEAAAGYSYEMKVGRETIRLSETEYRILSFLAAKPYQAFTRRRIVEAVHTERHPVTEATLDSHIAALREKLGFFGDYIQSVPYIGYRFKA